MDILMPLPNSSHGKRVVLVITDRFIKLTRALPVRKTTATDVATAFLSHCVYPYGTLLYLLMDNGSQFVSKFFSQVCATLGIKYVTTTAYHPQTNDQAERFKCTLLNRLAHYVSEHQLDWDHYIGPLVYAYNTQVHASTGTMPFHLTLARAPPLIAVHVQESIIPQDITEGMNPTQAKRYSRRRIDRILQSTTTVLTKAQRRYKCNFDEAVWNKLTFGRGDLVYLDRPPKDSEELEDTTRKLLPRSTGPYKVLKANEHTITLLIDGLQDNVSIDRVKRAPSSSGPPKSQPLAQRKNHDLRSTLKSPHPLREFPRSRLAPQTRWSVPTIMTHRSQPTPIDLPLWTTLSFHKMNINQNM
ncbi:unnamed protein product [Agarophyton chilense]